ncbi:MAG: metallophosphoesterase family protein [Saprospiraceae bacterium]
MSKFAISDIHGCSKTFLALLDKIKFSSSDELYLLGDYVDRGPDSKGVLDIIMQLQANGYAVHCLRGNHEQLVLYALTSLEGLENWAAGDGQTTLDSFGVARFTDIPAPYVAFLNGLHHIIYVDEYILVHAGLNFRLPDPVGDPWSLLTIRHWQDDINRAWLKNRIVVHGHTPMMRDAIVFQCEDLVNQQYLDIDGGCVYAPPKYTSRIGMGYLCAFDMERRQVSFQRNVE